MEVLEISKLNRMQVLIRSVSIRNLNPTFRAKMNTNISPSRLNSSVVISTQVRAIIHSVARVMTSRRYHHSTQERTKSLYKRTWNLSNLMLLQIISKRQSQSLEQQIVVQFSTHWQHNTTRSSLLIKSHKRTSLTIK